MSAGPGPGPGPAMVAIGGRRGRAAPFGQIRKQRDRGGEAGGFTPRFAIGCPDQWHNQWHNQWLTRGIFGNR